MRDLLRNIMCLPLSIVILCFYLYLRRSPIELTSVYKIFGTKDIRNNVSTSVNNELPKVRVDYKSLEVADEIDVSVSKGDSDILQKVYTFYEPCDILGSDKNLLQLWLRSWYAAGFHPRILRLCDAEKHSRFSELKEHFEKYPTVNLPQYELYCYMRWLAFSMTEGGLFLDYDIFPLNFNLLRAELNNIETKREDDVFSWNLLAPMVTFARSAGIERFISFLAQHTDSQTVIDGKPHSSDMLIARNNLHFYSELRSNDPGLFHASHFWHKQNWGMKTREESILDLLRNNTLSACNFILLLTPGIRLNEFRNVLKDEAILIEATESFQNIEITDKIIVFVAIKDEKEGPNSIAQLDKHTRTFLKENTKNIVPIKIENAAQSNIVMEYRMGYRLTDTLTFAHYKVEEISDKDLLVEGSKIYNNMIELFYSDFKKVLEFENQVCFS